MLPIKRTLLFIFLTCAYGAGADNLITKPLSFGLYADVDPSHSTSQVTPSAVTQFNGATVFVSDTSGWGPELWIKRGADAPQLLADVNPGPAGSYPLHLTVWEEKLYFTAMDIDGIRRLWVLDPEGKAQPINIVDSEQRPLRIRQFLVTDQGYYVLGFVTGDKPQKLALWHFSFEGELILMDDEYASQLQRPEVANLFDFDGSIYVFLYSDEHSNQCLLRRYSGWAQLNQKYDFACDAMNYDHQVKAIGDKVYFTGKIHLLAFDGITDPSPALSGKAPSGNLTTVNDQLYVSTTRPFHGVLPEALEMPYVYRLDEAAQSLDFISSPLPYNSHETVLEIATAAHGDMLYVLESIGYWQEDDWVFTHTSLYRYDTVTKRISRLSDTSLNEYGDALEYGVFLTSNSTQICAGEALRSLFCLGPKNQMQRQDMTSGADSVPSQLTVVDSELYFEAGSDAQRGLWKLDSQQNLELVEQGWQGTLISWHSDLYRLDDDFQLRRLDDDGNWLSLNQTLASFPQNVVDMEFGADALSMLINAQLGDDDRIEIWQLDANDTVTRILDTRLAGNVKLQAVADQLYLSVSPSRYHNAELAQQCAVYHVVDGELILLAEQPVPDNGHCYSWVREFEGTVLIYFEYDNNAGKHSSFASRIANHSEERASQLYWWWQDQPWHISGVFPQIIQNDAVFFCGKGSLLGNQHVSTVKFSADGGSEILDEDCFTDYLVSDFSGQSAVYLQMDDKHRLRRLQQGVLKPVKGHDGDYLGEIRGMVELNDELILSTRFSPENTDYGHELVRLSVVNDKVAYAYQHHMDIHLTANAEHFGVAQILAALDSDAGDALHWQLTAPPKHGSVSGLPVALTSEGKILEPESVGYKPHLGYVGRDTFEVTVSDGFSESTISLNVTVSDVNTANIANDASQSSGGSVGMLFLLLPIAMLRLSRKLLPVKALH